MSNQVQPFVLSIEPIDGAVYQHGFHLGTDLAVAKRLASEMFHARGNLRTVALLRGHRLVAAYDGSWL